MYTELESKILAYSDFVLASCTQLRIINAPLTSTTTMYGVNIIRFNN